MRACLRLIVLAAILLGGCGQKGALYLPDQQQPDDVPNAGAPPGNNATAATPADSGTGKGSEDDDDP